MQVQVLSSAPFTYLFGSVAQFWLVRRPVTAEVTGSSPVGVAIYAGIAQSVEQLICNQQVGGSNPSTSSNKKTSFVQ